MSRIFISYRRADSHAVTDRIYDHLSKQFGTGALFKDVDDIPIGDQFPIVITEAIIQSAVVLVIIGPQWASIADDTGQPRLNDPDDFVRQEVETALRHNKRIVPVLVEDARMPSPDDLPPSLHPLTERNAVTVRHDPYFREDIARLTSGIASNLGKRQLTGWLRGVDRRVLAGVIVLLLIVLIGLMVSSGNDPNADDDDNVVSEGEHGQVQIVEAGSGVFFLPANTTGKNHSVSDGQWISSGGTLTTFQDTIVRVNFALGAFSTVMPSAWVQLNNIVDSKSPMGFTIENSELFVFTGEWPGAVVNTLNGARATVTGSEMWMTDDQGMITTACFSGSCTVSDATNQTQDLAAGFMVTFDSTGGDLLDTTYNPQPIPPATITAYNGRCGNCIPVVSTPPVAGRVVITTSDFRPLTTHDFFAVNTDGSDLIVLAQPDILMSFPVWSPDGRQIAFHGSDETAENSLPQIYTIDADGSNLTRLTDLERGASSPDWSPDGRQIVFESAGNIFMMDADGSNVIQLTDNRDYNQYPVWSPDGNRIAFTSQTNRNYEIIVMEVDGWPAVNITRTIDTSEVHPSWSPDGSRIAFVSQREGADAEIYVMNADGTNPINLTQHEAKDEYPVWLPDGEHIAFISDRDSSLSQNAYVMNADGSDVTQILEFWREEPYPPGYDYVGAIFYLDWQRSGANRSNALEPVAIPPEALNAELAWRLTLPEDWGNGRSSSSGRLNVRISLRANDCVVSPTYDRYAAYDYTTDMHEVSAENVTYDSKTDTFTVTIPGVFITACEVPEVELTNQESTCRNPAIEQPVIDELARTQAQMALLESVDENFTEFENRILRSIEASLSSAVGDSNLLIAFDRDLSPPLPDSCVVEIPEGWRFDDRTSTWEPVRAN